MPTTILKLWNDFKNWGATVTGKINWTTKRVLTPDEFNIIRAKLKDNYYVIATRHNGHLSSYVISFAHFLFTGRWGYYGHVLMNLEDEANADGDYKFIEAIGSGVRITGFSNAIDDQTSSVALLKPKCMTLEDWTLALDKVKTENGKPYDTIFDLANDQALSCVEVVRVALQATPNYATEFAEFERMISEAKQLDPQMFYECPDFEVVWESRH
jgi:hypothetical protein